MIKYKYEKNKRVSTQKVNERERGLMKKNHFIQLITTGIIIVTVASGCNKSTASIPAASSDATVETTTEIETVETSGENLVSSESTTEESTTVKSADKETKTGTTEGTTDSKESSSKANDVETTTQAVATKAAATTQKTTEAATQKQTEKATEKTTEVTTQKQTEKATEKTTEATTQKQTEKTTEKTTEAHKHNYTSSVTKASTCTNEGVMTYKCSCGDSYTETIGKTAHSFGSYTYNNDATESADGTETAVCSVCGERSTRTAAGTKLAHVHSYTESVTTMPACTTDGVKTFSCSCGSSYTEAIPAAGHQFGDYTYNNDATTSADGTKTRYCLVCGETETVTAEGTKKSLPSWYDEHWQQLNTTMGAQDDGSLEAYYTDFDWTNAALGCWYFGYSMTSDYVGTYAEGNVYHGYLYK